MERYRNLPVSPFFDVIQSITEHEIRPGNTATFVSEVDLSEVETLRAQAARRPSYTACVVKALAQAMSEHPYANRRLLHRWWLPLSPLRMQQFDACDVTVACERDIPGIEVAAYIDVIREADLLSLEEITARLRIMATDGGEANPQWRAFHRIVTRFPRLIAALLVRLPVLFPGLWSRYRGGAAYVSSPAKYGVDQVLASWPAPLCVSFGLVRPRAVVRDGAVVVRPTFLLTLNFDRRVMAGAPAARFFRRLVEILERLVSEGGPAGGLRGEAGVALGIQGRLPKVAL